MKYIPRKPESFNDGTIDYDYSFVFGLNLKQCPNKEWTFVNRAYINEVIVDTYSIDIKISSEDGVIFPFCEAIVRTGNNPMTLFRFNSKNNIARSFFQYIEKHYIENIRIDNSFSEIKHFSDINNYMSVGEIKLINGGKAYYNFFSGDNSVSISIPYVNPELECEISQPNWICEKPKLNPIETIIVFDTETTGLYSDSNDMIQLSYQIINFNNWKILKKVNHYFPLPEDRSRVDWDAIPIDRLIKERKGLIKFSDQSEALKEFFQDLSICQLVVAHNFSFDKSFIETAKKRFGLRMKKKWPFVADTMQDTTEFCHIYPKKYERYKYPKLIELARLLHVPYKEDNFHDSEYDVDITKKCFKELNEIGFYIFRYDKRSINKKSIMSCSNSIFYY